MSTAFGAALVLLGCWGLLTLSRTLASRGGLREHRAIFLVGLAFVASCFLPGLALLAEAFRPWMLIPLGLCYAALIPLPCYFKWANDGWVWRARAVLYVLIAVGLVAAGLVLD